ncbi:MAG: shikimate kinase [Lachnospiraceae bacterium]|nr:shikimate kinase [Lachnospiraceae bacterium]
MKQNKQTELPFNIFLIGFMGAGKSTVASYMHRQYSMPLIEMDETLAERECMTIPEIFAQKGESYFRQAETELLKEIQTRSNVIISCGGGVAMRQENVEIMKKSGKVVLLTASPDSILERVKNDENRPLLKGRKTAEGIQELMDARRPFYEAAADLIIATDTQPLEDICEEIINRLRQMQPKNL